MKTKITVLIAFLTCIQLTGQVKKQEVKLRDQNGNAKFIELKETKVSNQKQATEGFLRQQYKTSEQTEFRPKSNQKRGSKNGFESQKLQQYFNGIKVEHGRLNTISKNGNLSKIVGRYVDVKNLSTTPSLTEEQALNFALQNINAKKYIWEDTEQEKPKGELLIIEKNPRSKKPKPKLAYKFNISSITPFSSLKIYVDANDGEIIYKASLIKHTAGKAQTRYSGTQTIEAEQVRSGFRLRDNTRGKGIHTLNMNNSNSYSSTTDFIDDDNNWTSAEYNNSDKDNAALDLHWGVMKTYDYFLSQHGRNSMDNNGFQIRAFAHFGNNYDNAQWDSKEEVIRFGDGGPIFRALTSIDVVAHEFGHGFDHFESKLEYSGESGAIDESLSDIWGSLVEGYAKGNSANNWLIGEEIMLTDYALRDMSNPKNTSNRRQPDTYLGEHWSTNGSVHTNSGVMNHWFYLLADGSSATDGVNDNKDVFNITGISKTKAAQIVYRAQTEYFNDSYLNYADARIYTLQAAEDLFGVNSLEASTTCKSWFAVGVGEGNCGEEFEIAGNSVVCPNNTYTYTATGLPPGASVSWTTSSNMQIVNTTSNSVTISTASDRQNGQISLTVNGSVSAREVWLGRPAAASRLFGPSLVNTGAIVRYYTGIVNGATSYEWRLPYPYNRVSSFNYSGERWELKLPATDNEITAFTGYSKISGNVQVWGKNACGTGGAKLLSVSHARPGGTKPGSGGIPLNGFGESLATNEVIIYPNPADKEIKISLLNSENSLLKIYTLQGLLIREIKGDSNILDLDVSRFLNGIYFLEIQQGDTKAIKKMIVQH
ncbi:MAG: bacillolysin [Mariniflexile sp.]|jgi:bacillolysin